MGNSLQQVIRRGENILLPSLHLEIDLISSINILNDYYLQLDGISLITKDKYLFYAHKHWIAIGQK